MFVGSWSENVQHKEKLLWTLQVCSMFTFTNSYYTLHEMEFLKNHNRGTLRL